MTPLIPREQLARVESLCRDRVVDLALASGGELEFAASAATQPLFRFVFRSVEYVSMPGGLMLRAVHETTMGALAAEHSELAPLALEFSGPSFRFVPFYDGPPRHCLVVANQASVVFAT